MKNSCSLENRDAPRRRAFEKGKALRYYLRVSAKKIVAPRVEDEGKIARKTRSRRRAR